MSGKGGQFTGGELDPDLGGGPEPGEGEPIDPSPPSNTDNRVVILAARARPFRFRTSSQSTQSGANRRRYVFKRTG